MAMQNARPCARFLGFAASRQPAGPGASTSPDAVHTLRHERDMIRSVATAIAFASLSVAGEPARAGAQELDHSAPIPPDPEVVTGTLENGLTYYIHENDEPENRTELRLVVNAGSILEDEDQLGLAHFVEHMAFNGTENFEKQALIDYLEGIGMRFGPHINAYTSFDETVYMLRVPMDDPEMLSTAFQILVDWAGGVLFDPEEVDKERGVVIEEWRGRRGGQARIQDQQIPVIFYGSHYADRLPIGDTAVLQGAPPEVLRRFYDDWYRPDLMGIVAVGDFDAAEMEAMVRDRFSVLGGPAEPRARDEFEVPVDHEPKVSIATDPEMPITQVSVLYKQERAPRSTVGDFRRARVRELYSSMLNGRLDELAIQADPPFLQAFVGGGGFVRGVDVSQFLAIVGEDGIMRGLDVLLTEAERVARHGFTETELEREKAALQRRYESRLAEAENRVSARLASRYVDVFLEGSPYPSVETEVELLAAVLPGITLDDANAFAKEWIRELGRVVTIAAPESEGAEVPGDDAVTETFAEVAAREVDPYEAEEVADALLAELPEGGTVVSEEVMEEIGVTIWELDNGVRVVLKPTDFRDDEILLRATSPGGTSLAADEILGHARLASELVSQGGVGDFDQIALDRQLADKRVSVFSSIGGLTEGIRGSASPQDLETALQLVYLRFVAPRKDETAFMAFLAQADMLANIGAQPRVAMQDTMAVVMGQGHPRAGRTFADQLADMRNADLDAAVEFYQDRFADASDFTFYLRGDLRYRGDPPPGRDVPGRTPRRRPRGDVGRPRRRPADRRHREGRAEGVGAPEPDLDRLCWRRGIHAGRGVGDPCDGVHSADSPPRAPAGGSGRNIWCGCIGFAQPPPGRGVPGLDPLRVGPRPCGRALRRSLRGDRAPYGARTGRGDGRQGARDAAPHQGDRPAAELLLATGSSPRATSVAWISARFPPTRRSKAGLPSRCRRPPRCISAPTST